MKVHDKTIVVTGGGNGLGQALVLNLLSRGARVAAVDINEAGLAETLAQAGDDGAKLSTHILNITDKAAVESLPQQLIARHGGVDGLINNAGIIQPFVKLVDLDYADIERVMQVNFYGALYMTKAFLPVLLERPEAHITNVSSMGGFIPVPGQTIYGASKSALKLFTEGLYSELLDSNIGVTLVLPGAMKTNIAKNSNAEISLKSDTKKSNYKMTEPLQAAQMIIGAMENGQYRLLIGSDSKMMDLFYRLNPKRATIFLYKQMRSLLQ